VKRAILPKNTLGLSPYHTLLFAGRSREFHGSYILKFLHRDPTIGVFSPMHLPQNANRDVYYTYVKSYIECTDSDFVSVFRFASVGREPTNHSRSD